MKKKLGLKKVVFRDLDEASLAGMAGANGGGSEVCTSCFCPTCDGDVCSAGPSCRGLTCATCVFDCTQTCRDTCQASCNTCGDTCGCPPQTYDYTCHNYGC